MHLLRDGCGPVIDVCVGLGGPLGQEHQDVEDLRVSLGGRGGHRGAGQAAQVRRHEADTPQQTTERGGGAQEMRNGPRYCKVSQSAA